FPLDPGTSYSLGRAATNSIVLKDDLCSRDHAEIAFTGGKWRVRDLGSLNGTRVNNVRVEGERDLAPSDELHLGRTHMVFVEDMNQPPARPAAPAETAGDHDGSMSIKKRLGQTRFLPPPPPGTAEGDETPPGSRHGLSRDLSLLYRLALDMGMAGN